MSRPGSSRADESAEAPGWQGVGGTNHGKKSRKFNRDCTICHSSYRALPHSIALKNHANTIQTEGIYRAHWGKSFVAPSGG